jgi:transcriptional regulator with XRE-family HTH domain
LTRSPASWNLLSKVGEGESDVNVRIAARVRALRATADLSLDALAARSGVSRSMISLVERGETSATAVLLEKLASGLGVTLASLFAEPDGSGATNGPLARRAEQPVWRDPASGYVRRSVSPAAVKQPMQLVEIHFPAGQRVAFENGARELRIHQQVWVLQGAIEVSVGDQHYRLREGDCLAMLLDQPTVFHNPTRKAARYAVVTVSETGMRR